MEAVTEKLEAKGNGKFSDVQSPKQASTPVDTNKVKAEVPVENVGVPSIRLSPEQIEEIHSDEYTRTLFYATRIEPLSLTEIKKQFPEPEPKKAQAVMDRFIKVGLIHITLDGKYYSNYPENYINYSNYRYDNDLEARKDGKVFELMKEYTGNKEYWKNKSYFSMDAFYTEEQTKEMQEMFLQIKLKAKEYANENAKTKSIKGLFFRRMKFFDMTFTILLAFFFTLGFSGKSFAGGNDPTIMMLAAYQGEIAQQAMLRSGGGNDPTGQIMALSKNPRAEIFNTAITDSGTAETDDGGGGHDPQGGCERLGGGGHDPTGAPVKPPVCCVIVSPDGKTVISTSPKICHAQKLLWELAKCESEQLSCVDIEAELYQLLFIPAETK